MEEGVVVEAAAVAAVAVDGSSERVCSLYKMYYYGME